MAVDATGTPSAKFSIPKYNTSGDAPSGKGLNNIIDSLDTILANLGVAGLIANDVPVYDSVAGKFKKATGTPSSTTFLRGDGSWQTPPSGAMTLICDSTLGGAQATFDTNTLLGGNIPSTFSHLKLVLTGRGDAVATNVAVNIRLNNDVGANYAYQANYGNGSTPQAAEGASQTSILAASITGASATVGHVGMFDAFLPSYAQTTFFKTLSAVGGLTQALTTTNMFAIQRYGVWANTAAITRITVLLGSGNFIAGSRFSLYGIS